MLEFSEEYLLHFVFEVFLLSSEKFLKLKLFVSKEVGFIFANFAQQS